MQEKPTKKTWQTPQFAILSRGDVNSGLNVSANEGTVHGTGNYAATLSGLVFNLPATEAALFGKNGPNTGFYKPSTVAS